MSIAIGDDHRELAAVVRRFLEDREVRSEGRARLDAPTEVLPTFWKEMADLGWLGLHVPADDGGSGFGLTESAIVVEEIGRAVAPGPFLSTIWASAVLAATSSGTERERWLPALADGRAVGAVALRDAIGDGWLAFGAELADRFLLVDGDDVLVAERGEVRVDVPPGLDPTRRIGTVTLADTQVVTRLEGAGETARNVGRALAAAEASGVARACVEMATAYVKEREQFGRPVGSFQAVKHHAANMLVATELATSAAWDAARAQGAHRAQATLASAVAVVVALPAAVRCAQLNIQLHGGIGFTWEHDAHLFLRRAAASLAVFGPVRDAEETITALRVAGVARTFDIELPAEAEAHRTEVRALRAELETLPEDERLARMVETRYAMPHWPPPWGRGAGPVEQLVIDQELDGIERPDYRMGSWIMRTVLSHGTPDQIERYVPGTLACDVVWCQLFSEPGAGSDAAGISTRGVRVDGGWRVTGQKVWTTEGAIAHRGFATVRTNPDVPKHAGLTTMIVDMHARGVIVRPLREATGDAMFSEVFLDDVFVPDDDVVGPVDSGWKVARSALAGERVEIGGRGDDGPIELLDVYRRWGGDDVGLARSVGALLAEGAAVRLLNLRLTERLVSGGEPGIEGNIAKLMNGEHTQRVADLALAIVGPRVALAASDTSDIARAVLWVRMLTIGGGTSEIVRNQIAEGILGLPREPLRR